MGILRMVRPRLPAVAAMTVYARSDMVQAALSAAPWAPGWALAAAAAAAAATAVGAAAAWYRIPVAACVQVALAVQRVGLGQQG